MGLKRSNETYMVLINIFNPFMLSISNYKLLAGSMILLTITNELRMILQNICRSVVGSVLIINSSANTFAT